MEKFKIEHFERDNPLKKFPWFRSLNAHELETITQNLSEKLRLTFQDNLSFTKTIAELGAPVNGVNAEDDGFKLSKVMSFLDIKPQANVYINWYRYDRIDEMTFVDLDEYFDDIWYPGPDDIDIFDTSFSWILSVSHDGDITFVKMS